MIKLKDLKDMILKNMLSSESDKMLVIHKKSLTEKIQSEEKPIKTN